MPRTSPSALTISVTTRPQPPWRFTRRRNAVSVMPAIGAMANGEGRSTDPIFMLLVSYWNDAHRRLEPALALGSDGHLHGRHLSFLVRIAAAAGAYRTCVGQAPAHHRIRRTRVPAYSRVPRRRRGLAALCASGGARGQPVRRD